MRVAFRSTLDEAVEVQTWILDRSRTVNAGRWKMAVVGGLIAGLITGAGTALLLPDLFWPLQVAAAVFAGLLGGINCYFSYRKMLIRNLRKVCREQRGTGGAVPVCIEIDDYGVHAHVKDTHVISAWAKVKEIEDRGDAVVFWMRDSFTVVARERGFSSPEQCEEFIELARRFHRKAQDGQESGD